MKYPIIATRGIVVFPGHQVVLEVGRKQSLNAVDFALVKNNTKAVLVAQKDTLKDKVENAKDLFAIGTVVTLKIEKTHQTGVKTIIATGIERVKLSEFTFEDFIEANATKLKIVSDTVENEKQLVEAVSKQLENVIGSLINVPKSVLNSLSNGISANELVDLVANYLPLTVSKRQQLLEEASVNKRLGLLLDFLVQESSAHEIDKTIDTSVRKTLDEQQKEFLLREKMKAIKEELGDISSKDSDVDKWKEALKESRFPEEVRKVALEEIKKFESTPQMAAESNVIRGYIEWIIALPWKKYSPENTSLEEAKKALDKNHYGLKKVKERILEHLAVQMNVKESNSPILTLVGPPGVGKTSLVKSIAEATGREFVKVSLGGVRDEAEIRGHRRTYVGALPGKIIQAFKKAKFSNPVILLDEIDKMSSDYKGDPTSAMLEVLDPEQNKLFQDHFLEIEYDLSKAMFVATANYFEQIPTPLLDRVEIIFLDQYTSEEKLAIAKSYIIPKTIKENGLSSSQFKIKDDVIAYIIDKYTAEAGVRGLQRELSKLARKIVVRILSSEIKGAFEITKEEAQKMLGKEQVFKEKLSGKSEIGLVNGMYYSSVGGGILPIEVTTYDSKNGGTVLTGSIKDVMKESLNIAIAYVRSHSEEFGITFPWETRTIQVHVPAGATPKDGPSAGIAFTTAVISALLGKPVPKELALTGEITLRGKVLPIGGLREKTLGAVEAGVTKIYIPFENKRDLDELAQKVKDGATIIPVESYTEIFKQVF